MKRENTAANALLWMKRCDVAITISLQDSSSPHSGTDECHSDGDSDTSCSNISVLKSNTYNYKFGDNIMSQIFAFSSCVGKTRRAVLDEDYAIYVVHASPDSEGGVVLRKEYIRQIYMPCKYSELLRKPVHKRDANVVLDDGSVMLLAVNRYGCLDAGDNARQAPGWMSVEMAETQFYYLIVD